MATAPRLEPDAVVVEDYLAAMARRGPTSNT